jgi:hypothetical protein
MRAWINNLESRWSAALQRSRFGRWLLRSAMGRFIARYFWVYIVYRILKWPAIALITFLLGSRAPGFMAWLAPSAESNAAAASDRGGEHMNALPHDAAPVRVGDIAPDFTLPMHEAGSAASELSLSKLRGRSVVLYFYPMDDTPG